MEISEKQIEDLIINSIESGKFKELFKRGLTGLDNYERFFRQVSLGCYGRLDLVGVSYRNLDQTPGSYKYYNIVVLEIKKGEINYNTFIQAIRYCKGIERALAIYNMKASFNIKLIGSSICKTDFIYLTDFMDNIDFYTIELSLEKGITFFEHRDYSQKKEDIKINTDLYTELKEYTLHKARYNKLPENLPF